MLYRVFPYLPGRGPLEPGGPLHVPRDSQGSGRHDNPERYAAMYLSRAPEAAVAERIQAFRGQSMTNRDLGRADGSVYALAAMDDGSLGGLVDLDDPTQLALRELRPSTMATRNRGTTQRISLSIYEEGARVSHGGLSRRHRGRTSRCSPSEPPTSSHRQERPRSCRSSIRRFELQQKHSASSWHDHGDRVDAVDSRSLIDPLEPDLAAGDLQESFHRAKAVIAPG